MIYCEDCSSYHCGCQERKEIESLRKQLAAATDQISAAIAACKVKDEALRDCAFDESGYCINPDAEEALAVTASISEWKTRWQKENDELRQQVTLLRDPLIRIDEVAKTSKTIISVASAMWKMLDKIRTALAATEPK